MNSKADNKNLNTCSLGIFRTSSSKSLSLDSPVAICSLIDCKKIALIILTTNPKFK